MRDEDGAPLLPSRVPIGGIVQLKRERGSATRPEAIAAYHDRRKVGYLPQEKRWIWEALIDSRHTVIVVGQVATTSGEIIAFDVEITVAERLPARIRRTSVTRQKRLLRLMPAFAALALTFATLVALERVDRKGETASPESPPPAVESKQAGVPPASRGPTFGAVATAPLVAALEARRAARDGRIEPDVISGSLQTETAFQDMRVGRRTIGRLVEDRPRDDATAAAKPSEPSVAKPLPRPFSKPTNFAAVSPRPAAMPETAAGLAVDGPIRPSFPAFAFAHGMAGLAASTREPAAASEPERATAQPLPEASDAAAPASPAAKPVIIVKPRAKPIRKPAKPIVAKPKPPAKQKKKRNPPPLAPRSPSGNAAESPDW